MHGVRHGAIRCGLVLLACSAAACAAAGGRVPDSGAAVRRPDWGRVVGWVLDASTRRPLPNARVAVELDGAFPERGRATDRTQETGRFEARAPLGSVSSKLDWGRVLSMHPIGLLLSPRSATKQTKIVDVTQVNVRVEAPGFKRFLGRVRAALLDPDAFSITLEDIWLAPEGSPLASFSPERVRLEAIESLRVEPEVVGPGARVRITLTARLPVERGFRYTAFLTSSAIRLVESQLELKRDRVEGQRVIFSREVTLPRASIDRWSELGFFLVRDESVVLRQRDTRCLLQVVRSPEERRAAEQMARGFRRDRAGDKDGAVREYELALREQPAFGTALLHAGDLYLQLNRPADAARVFRRMVEEDPRDYQVARTRYALALLENGRADTALSELAGVEKALGKQRVPAEVFLYRARALAAQEKFKEADEWLARAGAAMPIPDATVTDLNVRRMQAAVRENPESADLRLGYARVLAAARRQEEAVTQIRRAAALDPARPWPLIDLGLALWELRRHEEALSTLRRAVALAPENPEALLALAGLLRDQEEYAEALPLYEQVVGAQRLHLGARHHLALMRYATGQMPAARRELAEVVRQARAKGELVEDGIPLPFSPIPFLGGALYFGPKRRLAGGFSVPEAAADLAILEALQDLERLPAGHPNTGLLWQNIGHALVDLDLPGLALPALRRAAAADPSLTETRFLMGVALRKRGEVEPARQELLSAVAGNPLHPRARLELAQLLTDEGELEQAQKQLLAHVKNYPFERPPPLAKGL